MNRLDALLEQAGKSALEPLERARLAAHLELKRAPVARTWRREWMWLFLVTVGTAAVVVIGLMALGISNASVLVARLPTVVALVAVQVLASAAAMIPGVRRLRWAALGVGAAAMALIVLARSHVIASPTQPEWICLASHLGVALAPLCVGLALLRGSALNFMRAAAAGISVGTVGAITGELGCAQDWRHVLTWHVSAWILVIAAMLIFAPRLRPRSFSH